MHSNVHEGGSRVAMPPYLQSLYAYWDDIRIVQHEGSIKMSNIASALKEEIVRLARREIRAETEGLKKTSGQLRSEISALKKRVAALEKSVSRLSRSAAKGQKAKAVAEEETRVRFRADGLVSLRRRLGISASDMGSLLGVSAQTIYNWEAEKSRPRQQQLAAYAAMRGIGKKQAAARLEALAG